MTATDRPGASYEEVYRRSLADREGFWGERATQYHWYRKWDTVLDYSNPPFARWFTGGMTNLCYNAVDRHIKNGLGEKTAIIWEGGGLGASRIISYNELYSEVNRLAGALKALGVTKGDRILMFMPTVPEAMYAMLACTRLGAIPASVFSGYGTDSITERIWSARPKVVMTADASLRRSRAVPLKANLDIALEKAPVDTVVVLNRGVAEINMRPGRDIDWETLVREKGTDFTEPEPVESEHPSHIVFTSGDTGNPRGVVIDTGGYIVGLGNSMREVYGVKPDDVFWASSDIGWRVGSSYVLYGPLLYGATSFVFEGTPDYPDHAVYWRLIEKYKIAVMFTVPTVCKMLQRFGIEHAKKHDISSFRYMFLGGEVLDEPTWRWTTEALGGRPVIDHYWLTEAGWPMTGNLPAIELLSMKPGSAGKSVIGWDLVVVDKNGDKVPPGAKGFLAANPPLPPGNINTLWGADDFYRQEYWHQFPGKELFLCGDYVRKDEEGYFTILGRSDEVINVAAHRVGTREIAHAISLNPAVAEVCVVGVADALKGEEPVALVVVKEGVSAGTPLKVSLRNEVRDRVGGIASPRDVRFVPELPKNRLGQYMREVYKAVLEGRQVTDAAKLEENASAEEVQRAMDVMKEALGI